MAKVDPISNEIHDINAYTPMSGRVLGEDGKAYSLVELLLNAGTGGGGNSFLKSVPTYDDLPKPASNYKDELYFVQESTGGLFSFMGVYKYPRGFYAANADGEWEQVPINVEVSDNAFTIVNITDWAAFVEFTKTVKPLDIVLYNGVLYQNRTGEITDAPPDADAGNWRVFNKPTQTPLIERIEFASGVKSREFTGMPLGVFEVPNGTNVTTMENRRSDQGLRDIEIRLDRPAPANCYLQIGRYMYRGKNHYENDIPLRQQAFRTQRKSKPKFRGYSFANIGGVLGHDQAAHVPLRYDMVFLIPEGAKRIVIPANQAYKCFKPGKQSQRIKFGGGEGQQMRARPSGHTAMINWYKFKVATWTPGNYAPSPMSAQTLCIKTFPWKFSLYDSNYNIAVKTSII